MVFGPPSRRPGFNSLGVVSPLPSSPPTLTPMDTTYIEVNLSNGQSVCLKNTPANTTMLQKALSLRDGVDEYELSTGFSYILRGSTILGFGVSSRTSRAARRKLDSLVEAEEDDSMEWMDQ